MTALIEAFHMQVEIMEEVAQLKQQLADLLCTLYKEGILDEEHFTQLQKIESGGLVFISGIVSQFFGDAEKALDELKTMLSDDKIMDMRMVKVLAYKIKGGSASIGAKKFQKACTSFIRHVRKNHQKGCCECLHRLEGELSQLKITLQSILKLENDIVAAEKKINK